MSDGLPTAEWGKDDAGRSYGLQQSDAAFPQAAVRALEALADSVTWMDGEPNRRFADAFALWPTGNGAIAARLSDAGSDSAGRPHVLRIEAVYHADAGPAADPQRLAALLAPPADGSASPGKAADDELVEMIRRHLDDQQTIPRVLHDPAGGLRLPDPDRFDLVAHGPSGVRGRGATRLPAASSRHAGFPHRSSADRSMPDSTAKPPTRRRWKSSLIAVVVAAGLGVVWCIEHEQRTGERREAENRKAEDCSKITDLKNESKQKDQTLRRIDQEAADLKARLGEFVALKRTPGQIEADLAELSDLRDRHPGAAVDHSLGGIRLRLEKADRAVVALKVLVAELSADVEKLSQQMETLRQKEPPRRGAGFTQPFGN